MKLQLAACCLVLLSAATAWADAQPPQAPENAVDFLPPSSSLEDDSAAASSPPAVAVRKLGKKKKSYMMRRPLPPAAYPGAGYGQGPAYGKGAYGQGPRYPQESIANSYWQQPPPYQGAMGPPPPYQGGMGPSYYPQPPPVAQPWARAPPNAVLIAKKKKNGYKVKDVIPYKNVSPINMMYNWPYTPYNGAYQSPVYDSYIQGRGIYTRPAGCGTGNGYSPSCLRRLRGDAAK